jgi:hypothetical protein
MRLPQPFFRLPLKFDAERLRAEMDALPVSAWARHPTSYEGNSSLRLISVRGEENDTLRGPMRPTPHLRASPYMRQVLASFGVVWSRSRLMRLAPGAKVPEHCDASYHWFNRVRLHIPVTTHPGVRFHCDGTTVHMQAGEAWLFDNWRRHSVDNDSGIERVHLVADTTGSSAFWQFVATSGAGTTERGIPYQPGVDARVATEQTAPRPVMTPAEVDLLLTDLIGELVALPGDATAARHITRYAGILNGFRFDWRQLYLAVGENVAAENEYAALLTRVREATGSIAQGLVMRTNQTPAQVVLESRVLQHALRFDDLQRAADAGSADARNVRVKSASAPMPRRPLIIVAAPRSGSTLLFETLAVSPQLCSVGGEAHWLIESIPALRPGAPGVDSNRLDASQATPQVAEAIAQGAWSRMVDAAGQPVDASRGQTLRWLEKTPKNALRIPFFNQLFPDAQFLFLWRDPRENLSSVIEAWRAGGWVTYRELDGWDGPWSMILPPGYRELRGRPLEEVAAFQWERTNATILDDLAMLPEARWTCVGYEDFVADPGSFVQAICEYAGLEFDAALMARTNGPLPVARYALTPPAEGKWRRNESEILRVLPTVEATWLRLQRQPSLTRRSDIRIAR